MDAGLELDSGSVAAAQHRDEELERGLEAAGRPPGLLAAVRVDRNRQLLGHDEVFDISRAPPTELRPIAEVEVLRQRVRAPAAGILDRGPPPDPVSYTHLRAHET